MAIRPAESSDVSRVMDIFARCLAQMRAQGIDQWDEIYPNLDVLREDVQAGSLFVAEEDGACVGSVCLNDRQPEQYRSVPWLCTGGRALVVHRLCVLPACQGRGIGRQLMEFAHGFARSRGFACIRLEVYLTATAAMGLYARLGYRRVGQIRFPRRRLPFECMELVVRDQTAPDRPPPAPPGG